MGRVLLTNFCQGTTSVLVQTKNACLHGLTEKCHVGQYFTTYQSSSQVGYSSTTIAEHYARLIVIHLIEMRAVDVTPDPFRLHACVQWL